MGRVQTVLRGCQGRRRRIYVAVDPAAATIAVAVVDEGRVAAVGVSGLALTAWLQRRWRRPFLWRRDPRRHRGGVSICFERRKIQKRQQSCQSNAFRGGRKGAEKGPLAFNLQQSIRGRALRTMRLLDEVDSLGGGGA
jgi:hypothetical protein